MPPPQVFISYAKEDEDSARKLTNDLRRVGLSPWFDRDALLPGQDWKAEITQALENSNFIIILLSPAVVSKKGFVHKEIKQAAELRDQFPERSVFVLPVRLEPCELPYGFLRDIQWVDLFPDWERGISKLLRAMAIENASQIPKLVSRACLIVSDFRNFSKRAEKYFIGERYSDHILQELANRYEDESIIVPPLRKHGQERSREKIASIAKSMFGDADFWRHHERGVDHISMKGFWHRFLGKEDNIGEDPTEQLLQDNVPIYVHPARGSPYELRHLLLTNDAFRSRFDGCYTVIGVVEEPKKLQYHVLIRVIWLSEFDDRTLLVDDVSFSKQTMAESAMEIAGRISHVINSHYRDHAI